MANKKEPNKMQGVYKCSEYANGGYLGAVRFD